MTETVRHGPVPRNLFIGLAVFYLLLRVWMATLPGYVNDVRQYQRWALGTARTGIAAAYESTRVDYPPLYLYVLYGVGKTFLAIEPDTLPGEPPESALLTALSKSPHIVADLLLAWLLFRLISNRGFWGPGRRGPGWGRVAALAYLYNPAVLMGSAYWGQPDGVHSLLAACALAALAAGRPARSGAWLSAAGLMKPLAAPLVPLAVLAAGLRRGLRGVLALAAGGIAVAVAVFLPYLVTGRILPVLRKVLLDVEAMPFTSVNGHNLWWIFGPWRLAETPIVGPLTPKFIGITLFLALYAAILAASLPWIREPDDAHGDDPGLYGARLFLVAATLTGSFFFLSTHMHENHLFMAIPLLIAAAGRQRTLVWLAAGYSLASCMNMALHDLAIPYAIPGFLGDAAPVVNHHLERPMTWGQVLGSFVNTLLAGAVTWRLWLFVLRREPLDRP